MAQNNTTDIIDIRHSKAVRIMVVIFFIVVSLSFIKDLFQPYDAGKDLSSIPTISVSGTGKVFAAPDIATVSFDVTDQTKTVAAAQTAVSNTIASVKNGLEAKGVADADIQTTSYNSSPVYEYVSDTASSAGPTIACSPYSPCPPVNQKQIITGYSVTQSVEVKIRAIDSSGDIVAYLGTEGVTNISQVSFSVDKPDTDQASARAMAIADAQSKAQVLAKQLGVSLVRITSFSENGSTPYPMYRALSADTASGAVAAPASVSLPTGQNEFDSDVTISYEIR